MTNIKIIIQMGEYFTKGKKIVSILILMLLLIVTMFSILGKYYNWFGFFNSDRYNESIIIDTKYIPVEVPINEHANYEEGNEERNEEVISTYSLASLWDNSADDEKIIQDLIGYYIDAYLPLDGQGSLEHINQYNNIYDYFGVTTEEENEQLLKYNEENIEFKFNISNAMKIKNTINRDPIIMKSVFYTYKHLLYKSLSRKNYYKADINNYVDILILSYKDIYANDDPENVLTNLHKIAFSDYDETDNEENLLTISEIISDDYKREFRNIYYGNGTKVRDEDLFWAYTFWARRHHENNVKEIYDILVEVQNHYA